MNYTDNLQDIQDIPENFSTYDNLKLYLEYTNDLLNKGSDNIPTYSEFVRLMNE